MTTPARNLSPPRIELQAQGDFIEWLANSRGALAVTTYNSGKLAIFSAPGGKLTSCVWRFPRPMGVAFDAGRLAVATHEHIWQFRATDAQLGEFRIESKFNTGRLDAHDIAFGAKGLYFANTRFNCLARPSERVNFVRTWTPWFIEQVQRGDACHLNGLGLRDGRPALATAFCTVGRPGAWRAGDRFASGVVLDVRRNLIAAEGLCMPHSPRRYDGRWWFCNSGAGALCALDSRGSHNTVVELPGFTRGLHFAAGRAVVGLSRIRDRHILDAPLFREHFPKSHSGVSLVNVETGRETGRLEFLRGGREVYDAAFLPGCNAPELIFSADAG